MQLIQTSILLVATAALTACASSPTYTGGRSWDDGWRQGVVESVNDALKWNQSVSCSRVAAPGDKFVVVAYRASNKPRWKFIPMSPKDAPAPTSKVLINTNTCELVLNA